MISVRKYVNFIIDNDLTQSQVLFLMLIRNKNTLYDVADQYIKYITARDGYILPKSLINDLQEKGYVEFLVESPTKLSEFEATEKLKSLLIDEDECSTQFLRAYPHIIRSGSNTFPTMTADANKFRKMYCELIHYSVDEHKQMMLDLQYAIENNMILVGIDKYFSSEFYLSVREKREEEQITDVDFEDDDNPDINIGRNEHNF
jgi:hypothetical protein